MSFNTAFISDLVYTPLLYPQTPQGGFKTRDEVKSRIKSPPWGI